MTFGMLSVLNAFLTDNIFQLTIGLSEITPS